MAASIYLIVAVSFAFVEAIQGVCKPQLTANEVESYEARNSYSSADKECTYTITPASYYTRNNRKYYLKITWKVFDVNGDMPHCSKDLFEVFLTRSDKSIGKFCSNNAPKPFQMYSHDGYAKISFRFSSSYSKSSFGFYYQLKKYNDGIEGSSSMSTICSATYSSSGSNLIYSSGWPNRYSSSTSSCDHSVVVPSKYAETKVVFMDLDLYRTIWSCYSTEYVKLRGSLKSNGYKYFISGKVCSNTVDTKTYTTKDRYLEFTFSRKYGSGKHNRRGFVAGYISYGKRSTSDDDKSGLIAGTIAKKLALKIAGPAVVFIIVLAIYLVYLRWKKRRRLRMHEEMLERCARVNAAKNQEETAPLAPGTNNDSTTNPYPPAYTAAYPTAYPTATPAYPGSENALQPQPYPMSQQPFPTVNQGQYPPGGSAIQEEMAPPYQPAADAAPLSSGSYPAAAAYPPQQNVAMDANGSYPPSNVPRSGGPEAYPNVPPPAYNAVVN